MKAAAEAATGSKSNGGEKRKHFEAHVITPGYFSSRKPRAALVAKRTDDHIPVSNPSILPVQSLGASLLHIILKTPVPKKANSVCFSAIPSSINASRISATGKCQDSGSDGRKEPASRPNWSSTGFQVNTRNNKKSKPGGEKKRN
jgi:hypothetical protein